MNSFFAFVLVGFGIVQGIILSFLFFRYTDSHKKKRIPTCWIIGSILLSFVMTRILNTDIFTSHAELMTCEYRILQILIMQQYLCILIVFLFAGHIFLREKESGESYFATVPLILLPIGQLSFLIYEVQYVYQWNTDISPTMIPAGALMLTLDIFWFYWIADSKRWKKMTKELKESTQKKELEEIHYRAVEEKRKELSGICEGYLMQMKNLRDYVSENQIDKACEQMDSLSSAIRNTRETPFCSIPVINAVMTEKERICKEKGISLSVDLRIPEIEVDTIDLCNIFGNLMDNAIRGVEEWSARNSDGEMNIRITAAENRGYLIIRTKNQALTPSTKRRPGHGYGIKIMTKIAEKYLGEYLWEYENGIYTGMVMLRLQ